MLDLVADTNGAYSIKVTRTRAQVRFNQQVVTDAGRRRGRKQLC